jgi:Transposase, Mutator family
MPSKAKKVDRDVAKLPSIPKELVELFLTGPMTGEAINAAGIAFKTALIEASLNAELSHHLGYAAGSEKPDQVSNHRNGTTSKSVLTGDGKLRIETPRDREGSFEPLLLPKHARRFTAFDDSIVALYARGLTVREIQGYLIETYGTEVSPQLISTVTDGVLAEVTAWQSRPLESVYAVPLAMLSNFGPGVLANFGPPPVLQPTVSPIGSGDLLWTGKPKWICSSNSVGSMSLGSARSPVWRQSSAFIGVWYARRLPVRCRRRTTTRIEPNPSWPPSRRLSTKCWTRTVARRASSATRLGAFTAGS